MPRILFAEDEEFPVTVNIGVNLTVKRARLRAKEQKTERTFALCKTKLKKYLSPTPFEVPQRIQPATSEVEWVINGQEFKLSCLHPELTLPAAGKYWSSKYTVGKVTGIPSDLRTFPATPMKDWQPFVIGRTRRQREDLGLYEMIEQWIIPPDRPKLPSF
jgi:hypothetical protein